jgi:hypothetical protein
VVVVAEDEHGDPGVAAYNPFVEEDEADSRFSLRSMAKVVPRSVRWFWDGYVPFGKITNFEGDPEHGKSLTTLDLAARTSAGRTFPDQTPCPPCAVLLICDEDDYEDTIVPRLIAAGADRDYIYALHPDRGADGEIVPFFMPDDLPVLERSIEQLKQITDREDVFVIIDPVTACLSEKINSGVDASVRRVLSPLAELARTSGAAIVLVRHLNKNSAEKNVQYRGGGSIGFFAAARAAVVFGKHPDDPSLVVMAQSKKNLGREMPSLAYRIIGWPEDERLPLIEWVGATDVKADRVLGGHDARTDSPERDQAKEILSSLLDAQGGQVATDEAIKECKKAGISDSTARRAAKALGLVSEGVRSKEDGKYDHWLWKRPISGGKIRIQAQVPDGPS